MKRIFIIQIFLLISSGVFSQVLDRQSEPTENKEDEIKTIFGKDKNNGAYFDLYFNFTEIQDQNALEVGTRLSFILKHSLGIGVEGTGYVSNTFQEPTGSYLIAGGHGGITIEPIIFPKFPVHASFPVMFGGGASVYTLVDANEYSSNTIYDVVEGYLLARPGIELEFNVTKFFRICVNTTYRFATEINVGEDARYVTGQDLSGFSFGASFKFGKF